MGWMDGWEDEIDNANLHFEQYPCHLINHNWPYVPEANYHFRENSTPRDLFSASHKATGWGLSNISLPSWLSVCFGDKRKHPFVMYIIMLQCYRELKPMHLYVAKSLGHCPNRMCLDPTAWTVHPGWKFPGWQEMLCPWHQRQLSRVWALCSWLSVSLGMHTNIFKVFIIYLRPYSKCFLLAYHLIQSLPQLLKVSTINICILQVKSRHRGVK